jgi:5-hydroxyisourate hydrolase-like protein (transthyretin family)
MTAAAPTAPVTVSTHALDAERGGGSPGLPVWLVRRDAHAVQVVGRSVTDEDGRACLFDGPLAPGDYELRVDLGAATRSEGRESFLTLLAVVVRIDRGSYHVPFLIAANAVTVYRGS